MKTKSRQFLCLMLAVCLCIATLPIPALATAGQTPQDAPQSPPLQTEAEGVGTEALPTEDPIDPSSIPPQETPQAAEQSPAPADTSEAVEPAEPESTPSTVPAGEETGDPVPMPEQETPAQPEAPESTPTPEAPETTPAPEETKPVPAPASEPTPAPVPSDGLIEKKPEPVATLVGLDIKPISYAVVDEPLVKVTYHYTDAQLSSPTGLPTSSISAHVYHPLAKLEDGRMAIPANMFPGDVTVSTDALRVTLDNELDITAQAEYDPASGKLYLPARYWGHEVDVDWYCAYADAASITISVMVGLKTGDAFEEEKHILTLPSNADTIEIPLPEGENVVVT